MMMVMICRRKESGNFLQLLKQIESKERDYIVLVGQCPRWSVTQRITEAMALYCMYLVKVDDTSFVSVLWNCETKINVANCFQRLLR